MIRKPTWILLAILVVLLGGVFYLQKNPLPSGASLTPSATAQPPMLPGITSNDITWMEYKDAQGVTIQVSLNDQGKWVLGPEKSKQVDAGKMEQARSEIAATRVVTALPAGYSLDALGLAQTTQSIAIRNATGQQSTVLIGKETPTQNGYYVQVNGQAPVVVNKDPIDTIISLIQETIATPTPASSAGSTAAPQGTAAP